MKAFILLITSYSVLGFSSINDLAQVEPKKGDLTITALVARKSTDINELGYAGDWFDLKNNTSRTLVLSGGEWYLTDKGRRNPTKFKVPEISIPAGGTIRVWCDGMNVLADDLHTNFKLSRRGEHIALYKLGSGEVLQEVVSLEFKRISKPNKGIVLQPDGSYIQK